MGFQRDIERIIALLPPKNTRQTLLFSATVPDSIQKLSHSFLRSGSAFIDCVGKEETQTHEHVQQELLVAELPLMIPSILAVLNREMAMDKFKIMVFFTSGMFYKYLCIHTYKSIL